MWTADIGSWERGKNVDLPGVSTLKEALTQAQLILDQTEFNPPTKDPYIVQIFNDDGKIVFDYMNGGYPNPI